MLDVPGLGLLRIKVVQTSTKYDLRTEDGGIQGDGSLHDTTLLRRKAGRTVASAIAWFRTIQIAADASDRRSRPRSQSLFATVKKLRHRARTFLLMRANTSDGSQHEKG